MRFLFTSFDFYKRFLLVSLLINLLLIALGIEVPVILFLKIIGCLLLWAWYRTEGKKHLIFYHNFRWNSTALMAVCLIYDLLLFLPLPFIFNL